MSVNLLKAEERDCIKELARCFEANQGRWEGHEWAALGLTEENHLQVLQQMQHLGAIVDVDHSGDAGGEFDRFMISAHAVHLKRAIEEQEEKDIERKDLVEIVKNTVRKHPAMAWPLIGFIVITTVATAITQIGGALKMLHIID